MATTEQQAAIASLLQNRDDLLLKKVLSKGTIESHVPGVFKDHPHEQEVYADKYGTFKFPKDLARMDAKDKDTFIYRFENDGLGSLSTEERIAAENIRLKEELEAIKAKQEEAAEAAAEEAAEAEAEAEVESKKKGKAAKA